MNNWHGGVNIWLWGMNTLVILSKLSKNNCLIAYLDATKMGNLGLHKSLYKDKNQFLKFVIQSADAFLRKYDADMMPRKFKMKGLVPAESISNISKTKDVRDFLKELFDQCMTITGVTCTPLLVHTDIAGQLKSGIIQATRDEGQVTTQIMYSNFAS